jgi:predicted protein tyrosine phosphatase
LCSTVFRKLSVINKIKKLNILFICSRNKWRSATAETIYKNCQDHNVKSAGTEPSAVVKVSAKNILWADIIFTMEKKHRQRLTQKFPDETIEKKIIVLDIEDNYKYMDTELIEIIKTSVEPYLLDFSK